MKKTTLLAAFAVVLLNSCTFDKNKKGSGLFMI